MFSIFRPQSLISAILTSIKEPSSTGVESWDTKLCMKTIYWPKISSKVTRFEFTHLFFLLATSKSKLRQSIVCKNSKLGHCECHRGSITPKYPQLNCQKELFRITLDLSGVERTFKLDLWEFICAFSACIPSLLSPGQETLTCTMIHSCFSANWQTEWITI